MLSLPLVSQFPLGPSLCHGSLLCPGGRLSRLLHPGGRLSRLLRPGWRLSRLLRPGWRMSRLLRPGGRLSRLLCPGGRLTCQSHSTSPPTCQSHSTSPPTCQSHSTSPPTCQSHSTSPPTCQSHSTSPPTCQSHSTSPPTCQSHSTSPPTCQSCLTSPLTLQNLKWRTQQLSCQSLVTPQCFTQCHFTSLLSRPPSPGGLLSHLPHMDLALRSLPRFHLHSTALLDCALCEASGSRSLGGGGLCHESGCHSPHLLHHITAAHHPWTASPIIYCTHTFPSTITPITQLSPITHLS